MGMEGAAFILSKVALRYAWHAASCSRRFSGLNWNIKRKKSAAASGVELQSLTLSMRGCLTGLPSRMATSQAVPAHAHVFVQPWNKGSKHGPVKLIYSKDNKLSTASLALQYAYKTAHEKDSFLCSVCADFRARRITQRCINRCKHTLSMHRKIAAEIGASTKAICETDGHINLPKARE